MSKPTDIVIADNPATALRGLGPANTRAWGELASTYASAQARYEAAYYEAFAAQVAILCNRAGLTFAVMRSTLDISTATLHPNSCSGDETAMLGAAAHNEIYLSALPH